MADVLVKPQKVELPNNFKIDFKEVDETIEFKFNKPVKIPYDKESMRQYKKRMLRMLNSDKIHLWGPSINNKDTTALVFALIQATLPGYVTNEFYSAEFHAQGPYNMGMEKKGSVVLRHGKSNQPIAGIDMKINSPEEYFPKLNKTLLRRPTIDKGSFCGKVYFDTWIPHPKEGSHHYNPELIATMLASLFYNKNTTIENDTTIKVEHLTTHKPLIYIKNPTLERIQAAMKHEKEVSDFFNQNIEYLEQIAIILCKARTIHWKYIKPVIRSHKDFVKEVRKSQKGLDQTIPTPVGIDNLITNMYTHINTKLAQADKMLEPLKSQIPKGILEYAIN